MNLHAAVVVELDAVRRRNAAGQAVGEVIDVRPGHRVDAVVRRVRETADAVEVIVGVADEAIELVRRVAAAGVVAVRIISVGVVEQRERVEIAPALAHAGGGIPVQAGAVADETVARAVTDLVHHDLGIEAAVAVDRRTGEAIHLHAARDAVRRRREVRVVRAGAVLGVAEHAVAAESHATEVRVLEVARGLVEAERVEFVVVPVRDVEKLRHRTAAEDVRRAGRAAVAGAGRGLADFRIGRGRLRRRQEVRLEVARSGSEEVAVARVRIGIAGRPAVSVELARRVCIADVRSSSAIEAGQRVVAEGLRLIRRADAARAIVDPAVRAGHGVHRRVHADDRQRKERELRTRAVRDDVRRSGCGTVRGGHTVGLHEDAETRVVRGNRGANVLAPEQIAGRGVDDGVPIVLAFGEDDQRPGLHELSRTEREENRPRVDRAGDIVVVFGDGRPDAAVRRREAERRRIGGPSFHGQQLHDGLHRAEVSAVRLRRGAARVRNDAARAADQPARAIEKETRLGLKHRPSVDLLFHAKHAQAALAALAVAEHHEIADVRGGQAVQRSVRAEERAHDVLAALAGGRGQRAALVANGVHAAGLSGELHLEARHLLLLLLRGGHDRLNADARLLETGRCLARPRGIGVRVRAFQIDSRVEHARLRRLRRLRRGRHGEQGKCAGKQRNKGD